jgi:hypothetical protein
MALDVAAHTYYRLQRLEGAGIRRRLVPKKVLKMEATGVTIQWRDHM